MKTAHSIALWALSGLINEIKPAREVLDEMVEQAVDIRARKLPETVVAKP